MPNDKIEIAKSKNKVGTAYSLLKNGASHSNVVKFLSMHTGMSEMQALHSANKARELLKVRIEKDPDVLIAIHARRYDKIYKDAEGLFNEWIHYPSQQQDFAINASIIEQYRTVLKAMSQKERLYGLHGKDAVELIADSYFDNQKSNELEVSEKVDNLFDYSRLSIKELEEVLELMESSMFEEEEEFDMAPDKSKEVITSEPVSEKEAKMQSTKIEKMSGVGLVEHIVEQNKRLPDHLEKKNKTTKQVEDSLLEAMKNKIKQTYSKQDKDRDTKPQEPKQGFTQKPDEEKLE